MLFDSNIFIYAIQPKYQVLRQWCLLYDIWASEITRLEVLGYHKLHKPDMCDLTRLFELTGLYPVTAMVIDKAIVLRQQRKMSIGDAVIAATALEHRQTLVTRNVRDFEWIKGLRVLNPLSN
jgi:predicted nucleic acid-binding protein